MKNKNQLAHNVSSSTEAKTASVSDECTNNDELILHPTIQAIKELTGYMPKKILWDLLAAQFPDGLDMEKARYVLQRWTAKGWNPFNLDWLFNWYLTDYYYEHPLDNIRWKQIQHRDEKGE